MSCLLESQPLDPVCILQRLRGLSSAEDFFHELRVPYDPAVLAVARLHILKRMGEYLDGDDLDGLPDSVAAARAQNLLARAYADFVASSPLKQRVFRVLKDRDPERPAPSGSVFVSFDDIAPLPASHDGGPSRDDDVSRS
jgi:nitrogenase-stabilizing/protective protein